MFSGNSRRYRNGELGQNGLVKLIEAVVNDRTLVRPTIGRGKIECSILSQSIGST